MVRHNYSKGEGPRLSNAVIFDSEIYTELMGGGIPETFEASGQHMRGIDVVKSTTYQLLDSVTS